jgi:folate-dependent phosphoribosylglycinamide formyltransferase PurN
MENWKLIFNPKHSDGPMNIVCFGSGSGTTIEAILSQQKLLKKIDKPLYRVRAILVNKMCRCVEIARKNDIPLILNDRRKFFEKRNAAPDDEDVAEEYDRENLKLLKELSVRDGFQIDLIALAGYSSIIRKPLLEAFGDCIINSHPADLSLLLPDGTRKYKGLYGSDAIYRAMVDGEKSTKTCIHLVTEDVDAGEIIVSSKPLNFFSVVEELKAVKDSSVRGLALKAAARYHQELQKKDCDYPAYLTALKLIAEGRIGIETGKKTGRAVFLDGKLLGYGGVQLE